MKPENAPRDRRIESKIMRYIDGVGSSAIRGLLSGQPTRETFETVAYFMGVQFNRLPSFGAMVSELYTKAGTAVMRMMASDVGRMQSIIERYTENTGESIDVSAKSIVEAVQGNEIEFVATEWPFLENLFTQAENIMKVIMALDWQILKAPWGTGFIISGSPVVIVPPKGTNTVGFGVSGAVKYFPLTYSWCVRLGDPGGSRKYRRIGKDAVRIINYNIAANSERFVMGPEKAQLASVVAHSESEQEQTTPRWVVETKEHKDGGSMQVTLQPRRYFYGRGFQAP